MSARRRTPRGPIGDVETAARRVLRQIGPPLHVRATVAALETEGLRDADAARIAPGCPTLFDLGEIVHERCAALAEAAATLAPAADGPADSGTAPRGGLGDAAQALAGARLRRFGRSYWAGVAYTLPLIAQGLCVALLGVSLWGSAGLGREVQTAIALALVASLILTAPLTHAMTRRLFHYWFQWDLRALERTAVRWTVLGCTAGILAAAAAAAGLAAGGGIDRAGATFIVFIALQPALWMANSVLYVIRRAHVAAIAVLAPAPPLWAALRSGVDPVVAHALSLALADAILLGATWVLVRRRARGWPAPRRPLPRAVLPLSVAGYATWGLVYFGLIFGDRLVAWWDGGGIMWRPAYEAALQVALLPLLLTLPLLEHMIVAMGDAFRDAEARAPGGHAAYGAVEGLFVRTLTAALVIYTGLALAVWVAVDRFGEHLPLRVGELAGTGHGRTTLAVALVAYGCFVLGLGVGAAYQLIARPWPMVGAGLLALVADVGVAVAARSHGPAEHAVFGLLAGGAVFALTMCAAWAATRRRIGYWWFASA